MAAPWHARIDLDQTCHWIKWIGVEKGGGAGEGALKYIPLTYRVYTLSQAMILDYRNKETEAFAQGEHVRQFSGFERQGWRRLEVLDAVTCLSDLRALPSNRLEVLRGDRDGQFSIRINGQWRICFIWPDGETGPSDVEIVDYH